MTLGQMTLTTSCQPAGCATTTSVQIRLKLLDATSIQDIDVLHMTDFQLVCEKLETVIRYWIKCWNVEDSHMYEMNGRINGMSAFADHREEHLR